ncbi:helix-turn-helix domain-containing protein [Micromonospora sp. CA-263727]|uniref:helix-turn-helix domain-containing protein n=1 Tax=Micromonospora sp. CA-263727 TaxID=3239967 RepID=UPI003D901B66
MITKAPAGRVDVIAEMPLSDAGWRPHGHVDPRWWTVGSFEDRPLTAALRQRDIGTVYRFLKSRGWSQSALAAATGTTENQVRAVIRRHQRVMSYDVLERIATGLEIPRGLMGLAYGP